MDSSDKGNSDGKGTLGGRKLSGGLSASDLRARLGLKSGNKPALGSNPANPAPGGPLDANETSQIERSVLESLRKDIGIAKKRKQQLAEAARQAPPAHHDGGESTQALSLDDIDDLLVEDISTAEPIIETEDIEEIGDGIATALDAAFGGPPAAPDLAPPPIEGPATQQMTPAPAIGGSSSLSGDAPIVEPEEEEEEEEDDGATQMLDTASIVGDEEEEFDAFPEEATQIMMPAMDFDPLTGKLVVQDGDAPQSEYILARDKTGLGRGTNNAIVIPDIAMSRRHLVFERYAEGFVVRDLDSGNGTFVNNRRVVYAELRDGDIVDVGNLKFAFEQSGGDPEKLWKGAAKVQIHEKDTGGASAAPPSAPAAPHAAMGPNSGPQQPGQPQILLQQQNPMLQQQMMMSNPNIPVHGTNPYNPQVGGYPMGGGYPPGFTQHQMQAPSQQSKGSPIVTALIVFFSILLLGLLGLIVWSVMDQGPGEEKAAQGESAEEKAKRAQEFAQQGLTLFDQRRWDESLDAFTQAQGLDPNNADSKLYLELIPQEKANDRRIRSALTDVKSAPSSSTFDIAIQALESISPDSVYAKEVKEQHLPSVKKAYKKYLLTDADKLIDEGKFIRAKRHLETIETKLGMDDDSDVKKRRDKIEKKEKEAKDKE